MLIIIRLCYTACGILVPKLSLGPKHLAVKLWSPNH